MEMFSRHSWPWSSAGDGNLLARSRRPPLEQLVVPFCLFWPSLSLSLSEPLQDLGGVLKQLQGQQHQGACWNLRLEFAYDFEEWGTCYLSYEKACMCVTG